MTGERREEPVRGRGLALVGYRGAGKSAVGRIVAERLGLRFEDADRYLERIEGRSIPEIFAERGEPYFREIERRIVDELTSQGDLVLATGGGAILREENRLALRRLGPVVWLRATPEELTARIEADSRRGVGRPALTAAGTLAEIRSVLESRTPLYQEASDFAADAEGRAPDQVAELVIAAWRSFLERLSRLDLGDFS